MNKKMFVILFLSLPLSFLLVLILHVLVLRLLVF